MRARLEDAEYSYLFGPFHVSQVAYNTESISIFISESSIGVTTSINRYELYLYQKRIRSSVHAASTREVISLSLPVPVYVGKHVLCMLIFEFRACCELKLYIYRVF
jgi:hypothetical protein